MQLVEFAEERRGRNTLNFMYAARKIFAAMDSAIYECNRNALLYLPGGALAWAEQHRTRTHGEGSTPQGLGYEEKVVENRKRITMQPWEAVQ